MPSVPANVAVSPAVPKKYSVKPSVWNKSVPPLNILVFISKEKKVGVFTDPTPVGIVKIYVSTTVTLSALRNSKKKIPVLL